MRSLRFHLKGGLIRLIIKINLSFSHLFNSMFIHNHLLLSSAQTWVIPYSEIHPSKEIPSVLHILVTKNLICTEPNYYLICNNSWHGVNITLK